MNDDHTQTLSMEYILAKIDQVANDTAYLREAIAALQELKSDPAFADNPEGDNAGAAKAQALGSAVKCRETTNQQLLALYTRMYQDLKNPSTDEDARKMEQLRQLAETFRHLNRPAMGPVRRLAEKILGLPCSDDDGDDDGED